MFSRFRQRWSWLRNRKDYAYYGLRPDVHLCPCGSGKLLNQCHCLRLDGYLLPPDVIIPNISNKDGAFANSKCFARELGDCSRQISREHFVSAAILREMEAKGQTTRQLKVMGFPWQSEKKPKQIGSKALASKILCERHNNMLSGLDEIGAAFFRAFHQIDRELNSHPSPRSHYLFNGHDLERWILKAICGIIASGSTINVPSDAIVPKPYLQCLFDGAKLPSTWGLYLLRETGEKKGDGGVGMAVFSDGKIVHGLLMTILAFQFILALHSVPKRDGLLVGAVNRPEALRFHTKDNSKEATIILGWEIPGDGGVVDIAVRF